MITRVGPILLLPRFGEATETAPQAALRLLCWLDGSLLRIERLPTQASSPAHVRAQQRIYLM